MKLHDLLLSTRITIGVLAMVVAGTATLLFIENTRIRDVYLSERRAHLGQDVESGKLQLNQAINALRQDVLFLSSTPPVSGIVRAALNRGYDPRYGNISKVWEERLQQIFSAFLNTRRDYYQIRYIGVADDGREIVRIDNRGGKIEATPPDRLQARSDLDYFKAALDLQEGQVSLSEFDLGQEREVAEQPYHPALRAATPVFTPSGKLFGLVIINMDAGSLLKSAVTDVPGVQTYIANKYGQYLLHPDPHRAFKFEPGGKDEITADFPFTKIMFNPQTPDYLLPEAAATKPGSPLFAARRIHFDSGDPSRFLILMHYLPDAVIEQQVATIPVQTIIYELLAMLLAGGIAALVLRRTFSPLKQVTMAANKIAAGDQDIRLPLTIGGEIGSLANAFSAMLSKLSQREKLLQESEGRFRGLVETASDWIWEVDENSVYTYTSPQIHRILGYEAAEIIGKTPFDLMPAEEAKRVAGIFGQIAAAKKPFTNIENTNLHKDGRPVILETSGVPVINTEGKFCGYRGIDRDITERKRAEELLRKSSKEIEDLYNHAPCGYHSLDKDGIICRINDTELAWLGYTRDEVIGKMKLTDLLTPAGRKTFHETFPQLKKQGFAHDIELELIRRDGTVFTGLVSATAIYDTSDDYVMSRSTVADITVRKAAEQKLHDLTEHLQAVREEEKASIAREIHDDLGGMLTALKMETYCLKTELPKNTEMRPLLDHVEEMSRLINNAADIMRNIITGLRPSILDDLGLLAALEWQAAQFHKRTGIKCRVNCIEDKGGLDRLRSIALFRIS